MPRAADGAVLGLPELLAWLAARCGLPLLHIDPLQVDVAQLAEVMSERYAARHGVLPVQVTATEVVVATAEPYATRWVPDIERQTRRRVRLVLANPLDVARYTAEFYTLAQFVRQAQKDGAPAAVGASFEQWVEPGASGGGPALDANDKSVVQVVDWLWQYAFDQRASDIHLEPRREQGIVRFRIDGVLHRVYQLPLPVMAAVVARIKLLGRMDVVEKRRPLDGRIKTRRLRGDAPGEAGGEVEMRLSTLPTAFGEKMVMRIFDPQASARTLDALGFSPDDAARWRRLIARPHGIVLVTGPTGSGKTTTLYATLRQLATEAVNVSTIEDPIEMIEPAFNQTQVQPQLDLDFAAGLRALMRQDPDVIMVGEIRDLPTAEMAVQAALTGHLVFATLHTNDAPSAITRLLELGVAPYLINATVQGVLAQRLVRTLCPHCKTLAHEPAQARVRRLLAEAGEPPVAGPAGEAAVHRPQGCAHCRMTGYRGRLGLYELLEVGDVLQARIGPQAVLDDLRRQARREGMRPLRVAGLQAVLRGWTTLEEVAAATPDAPLAPGNHPHDDSLKVATQPGGFGEARA
ncbi:MAG: Type II secretion system protein E [Paracidovorax wautersii]|uniref:Type II secretion system protein E n=1 Tax=Paracidovorax wautersii TaxID=1177982 RepID=A0A7V8FRJ3_9BURK|nr:MAG: Type II secretion system protein E [Paracidovorax wautersii]